MGHDLTALDATIVSTLATSCVIGAALYILFEFNRHVLDIYAPRLRDLSKPPPPAWKPGVGNWLTTLSEEELKTFLNLDAWVVLHFLKFCGKLCLFTAGIGIVVLWPTYKSSQKEQANVHGVSLYTMAQLDSGSARLWVPAVVTWLFVSATLRILKEAYQEFAEQRLLFLLHDDRHTHPQKRFSVMVQNLPRHLITTSAQLHSMFDELFPGQVHSSSLITPVKALKKVVEERDAAIAGLEGATASYEASGRRTRPLVTLINAPPEDRDRDWEGKDRLLALPMPPKVVVEGAGGGLCSCCDIVGEQKDAIEYYTNQLSELNSTVEQLHNARGNPSGESSSHGYVPPESERLSCVSAVSEDGVSLQTTTKTNPSKGNDRSSFLAGITEVVPEHLQTLSGWTAMAVQGSVLTLLDQAPDNSGGADAVKGPPTTTGFVTFKTRGAWLTAHRLGTLSDAFPDLCILPAPAPKDLIWDNLMYSTRDNAQGALFSSSLLRLGLIFWGSLISVVTALSNLETLEEYFPFIEHLDSASYALLAGILPVTLMALLLASVPQIISSLIVRLDHLCSTSSVQVKVFRWTFAYLLANMFVSIISGSISRSLEDFADSPKLVLSFLADSFPATSVLFCNYVISVTLVAGPNELLQILPLLHFVYCTRVTKEAQLTKRKLFSEAGPLCKKHYPYGGYLPQYVFVLTIVLFFSVISPLVPLVAFFFFVSRYFILRHQFLYVYTPQYSLGGQFWFDIHYYTMQALLLFAVTMVLYTSLKQGFYQSMCMLPLPFIIWYHWGRVDSTLGKLTQDIAYAKAMQDHAPGEGRASDSVSVATAGGTDSPDGPEFSTNFYIHPALLAPVHAAPLSYRIGGAPLLAPSSVLKGDGLCSCWSLIAHEVTEPYFPPLESSSREKMSGDEAEGGSRDEKEAAQTGQEDILLDV